MTARQFPTAPLSLITLLITISVLPAAHASTPVPFGVATFTPLPHLPNGPQESYASTLTDDGRIVVGLRYEQNTQRQIPIRWVDGVAEMLPLPPGQVSGGAEGVSRDGSVIVGYTGSFFGISRPTKWDGGTVTVLPRASISNNRGSAKGVALNGTLIVGSIGSGGERPARFTGTTASYYSDLPGNPEEGDVKAVSNDGRVAVGYGYSSPSSFRACRWIDFGPAQALSGIAGVSGNSEAFNISQDGSVIVGYIGNFPVRWVNNGTAESLGTFSGGFWEAVATSLTDDGRSIVGFASPAGSQRVAFLWREGRGIAPLQSVLESEFHLGLPGWTLAVASGITATGNAICGWGINPHGEAQGWIVHFALPCFADLNNTGTINNADLVYFLGRFGQPPLPDEPADLNNDGAVDTADLVRFLGRFGASC
ncbi:MAG: GC-type dockerin domain-anchored protein [Phycisphaerales bacterium]